MSGPDQLDGDSSRPAPRQKRSNDKTSFIVAWTGQVSRDPKLSKGANRIAPSISQNLWPHDKLEGRYVLKKGQKFFSNYLEVSRKSIQIWFDDLIRRGHLEVVVRKGQGQINEVMPVLIPRTKSATVPAPMADETPSPSKDETMPPVDVAEAEPADPLRLPDDGVTEILHEVPLSEVEPMVWWVQDDIAWLRANGDGSSIEEMESRENQLGELVDVLCAAFPAGWNTNLRHTMNGSFARLIVLGSDPLEIIRDAREYVRAAEAAGKRPMGPFNWFRERLMTGYAARQSKFAAAS